MYGRLRDPLGIFALKIVTTAFVSILLTTLTFAQSRSADHVPGRLLVQVRRGASATAIEQALRSHGAAEKARIPAIDVIVLQVPEPALDHLQAALIDTGLFTFVEPDGIARQTVAPNDPQYPSQWHLGKIQAAAAWDVSKGITSSPIAVIDSGVQADHPDLAAKLVAGWNFLTGTSNVTTTNAHGTAVAGTVAAATDNAAGVAGVAWASKFMPLVVIDSSGYATYSNIANAITYAADHGARVMNISIAGSSSSSTLQTAVNYAWNKGALIFAAAGNYSTSTPYYPAACTNVLAIAATTSTDARSSYSNYGSWIDLSAPGDSILTTTTGSAYAAWSGTSFASPVAAGVAALVLGVRPALANSAAVTLLQNNSDDIGAAGYDQNFGWGRVNAYKAVTAALNTATSTDTTAPTVSITSPANGAKVAGTIQIQGTATDNVGVAKIELYIDGTLKATAAASPFAFSWSTTAVANATHTLTVKAYDTANNVGSSAISVAVSNATATTGDIQPPVVAVTNPVNGSYVSGNVKVSVNASDNVGVSQISVYLDGVQVAQCTAAPCVYTWNTRKSAPGTHTIIGKAWDPTGNVGSSAPDSVTK